MQAALESHVMKLYATGCVHLLFDIAILPDIRNQYATDADANLKKLAQRFKVDVGAIAKDVRAKAKQSKQPESKKGAA